MGSSPVVQSSGSFSVFEGPSEDVVFGFLLMRPATLPTPVCSRANALSEAARVLQAVGVASPRREARLLLGHALGLSQEDLLRDLQSPLQPEPFFALVKRRAMREPLAYITGQRGFWNLDLLVSPDTLIPRPETETLVEAALEALPAVAEVTSVLDIGTGTGCLLLATLTEFPRAFGVGIDIVPGAATLASRNAGRNGLANRAFFLCADWTAAIVGHFDLVLCNPPYIATAEIRDLEPEVAKHEPGTALDGGHDGLGAYRKVIARLPESLTQAGVGILELGASQAEAVATLAREGGFDATLREDLSGIPRALVVRRIGGRKTVWHGGTGGLASGRDGEPS
jgi:release factor glutamine methyltransferase